MVYVSDRQVQSVDKSLLVGINKNHFLLYLDGTKWQNCALLAKIITIPNVSLIRLTSSTLVISLCVIFAHPIFASSSCLYLSCKAIYSVFGKHSQ